MSKESKATPREFWIAGGGFNSVTKEFIYNVMKYVSNFNFEGSIHTIEYSALLEERAKSARLLEALEYAKGQLQHAGYTINAVPVLDKAIRDYNQSEGGE